MRRDRHVGVGVLARVICCSGNWLITLPGIGQERSSPHHKGMTSLLRALANQLSTYGLTQVGCPLQPQTAAVAARRAPEKEVQALGADLAEGDGLVSCSGIGPAREIHRPG